MLVGLVADAAGTETRLPRALVRGRHCQLDLAGARWIEPVVLVAAAALAHRAVLAGEPARLRSPRDGDLASYLSRMRLGAVLSDFGVAHDLPRVTARDRAADLLELRAFETEREVEALAALVHDSVTGEDPAAARALHQAIVEVGSNVPEHAQTPLGFLAAQSRPSRGEVLFAVADAGVGLHATLAGQGSRDEAHAVDLALAGVSERGTPGAGRGLPTVLRQVSRLRGHVWLASGAASNRAHGISREPSTGAVGFPGTLLQGRVRFR